MESSNQSADAGAPSARTLDLLWALQLRGIGAAAVRKLVLLMAKRPNETLEEMVDDRTISSITTLRSGEAVTAKDRAKKIVDACLSNSVSILSPLDRQYPCRLGEIRDFPPIIYVKGDSRVLNNDGFAVVGTREASEAGLEIARRVAKYLVSRNVSVVSGLALGIDSAAHKGAIEAFGITIAVLAHGLDKVAPTSNRRLADQIVELGGALLSEHEPGVPPRPAEFVRRNRIQSGMSLCSVIVESGAVGGAIHQARFTRDQGRLVVVANPNFDGRPTKGFNYEGAFTLIREMNAIPLVKAEELGPLIDRAKEFNKLLRPLTLRLDDGD